MSISRLSDNQAAPYESKPSGTARRWWLPCIVLCISLGITLVAWLHSNRISQLRAKDRFLARTNQVRSLVEQRMLGYEQVLRGGLGLFSASEEVSREEWEKYVANCEVQTSFPGIQAMGFAVPLSPSEKNVFENSMREEGFSDFKVTPTYDRQFYTSIKYIEPFDWRNQRAFGYDMWSNPTRSAAMERAVDTGLPSVSGKITLVQETDQGVQAGVLCYLPLYDNQSSPTDMATRRTSHRGWVYAAFRCEDLMRGILHQSNEEISIEVFDTFQVSEKTLLFESANASQYASLTDSEKLSTIIPVMLSGRAWTLRFAANNAQFQGNAVAFGWVIAIGGVLISFLLFAIVATIIHRRDTAYAIAREMTTELRESESYVRSILENASEAILTVSADGSVLAANHASQELFQAKRSLVTTNINDRFHDTDLDRLLTTEVEVDEQSQESGIPVTGRRVSGGCFPCRIQIDHIKAKGSLGFIVMVRDETARVENARAIEEINQELVEASHKVGMAEVITGVLHNVGNVLNSVNVSADMLRQRLDASPVNHLVKASEIISEHQNALGEFFASDKRGQHFPALLQQLASKFQDEQDAQLSELQDLKNNIEHIKEIVSMQQSSAKNSGNSELVEASRLFEDAVKMNLSGLRRHGIDIQQDYDAIPNLKTKKHAVLQILVNLIRNAKQAVDVSANQEKAIRLSIRQQDQHVLFSVNDTGVGISAENMEKMFQRGFTTKHDGHGFGLHASAKTAKELGGSLSVESQGEGEGATFTLKIPATSEPDDTTGSIPTVPAAIVAESSSTSNAATTLS